MPSSQQVFSILKVNPLNENRCCGLRKDGRPCNNQVAIASRQDANRILLQCAGLASGSRQLRDNFKAAASLLLCKRWHQNQRSEVVDDWLRSWQLYHDRADSGYGSQSESESEEEEVMFERPRHPLRVSSAQPSRSRTMTNTRTTTEPSAYENLVLAILSSNISNDAKVSILLSTTPPTRQDDSRGDSSGSNNVSTSSPHGNARNDPPVTQRSPPQASPVRLSRSSTSSSNSSARVQVISLAAPAPTSSSLPPPSRGSNQNLVQATTPPPSPLRDSHLECRICFESYDDRTDGFWECAQCQNRVHMDCHQLWCASSRRPNSRTQNPTMKCVYCRAVIPPL